MPSHWYFYLPLFTAGTLLTFFWMVVILGHRRQRNFERILFFLCLALFLFYGCSLLALNAQIHYGAPPLGLMQFAWTFLCIGLTFVPVLTLHLHVEYARIRELLNEPRQTVLWLLASYAPLVFFAPRLLSLFRMRSGFDFITPINLFGPAYEFWLAASLLLCSFWQWRFAKVAPDDEQKSFHRGLLWELPFVVFFVVQVYLMRRFWNDSGVGLIFFVVVFPLAPLGTLVRKVQKFNFLQIGRQRNLIYAVFLTFVALLYLSLVRRVSQWLEPTLPPEATAAILLFLPVVFFEPLQRMLRTALRKTAQSEMDITQRMMGPIREVARRGDSAKLKQFVEQWVGQQLELAKVELILDAADGPSGVASGSRGPVSSFAIQQSGKSIGTLRVTAHGAMLSGETWAALEILCEQLPSILDLCRLLEEKLGLERELAERERLALVGQTAASISHNLKNPLGAIKTILQVQLESPELPASLRPETQMVLDEISRLSAKLNQLLQFSRPTIRGEAITAACDAATIVREVATVLKPEADRRGVTLQAQESAGELKVAASAEALNDVVSNLIVNALEASGRGGKVLVSAARRNGAGQITVEDDGPGIPESVREKVLQPFFTTKSQGTGLGLAIVARRVAEFGGKLEFESPVKDAKGTRFEVTIPCDTN